MATTGTSDVAYLSKIIYPDGFDEKALVRKNPLLANTKHVKNFSSAEGISFPAPYGNPQGAASNSTTANTNASSQKGKKFLVPQVSYYTIIRLTGKVVRNALNGNNEAYFMDQLEVEMNGAIETMGSELNRQGHGTGDGWRAKTSATVAPSGTSITLENASDVQFFEPDMVITASATSSGAIAAGTPGYSTVVSVNEETGVLTMSGTITTQITGISTGWHLHRQDDAINNTGTAVINFGLDDWNPGLTSGLGTSFCGITRSVYPSRLAGSRYTGTNDQMQTVFIRAFQKFQTQVGNGWADGEIYIHPLNLAMLMSAVEGTRIVDKEKVTSYDVGIKTFTYQGMTFIPDAHRRLNTAKVVAPNAFQRASNGDQPIWADDMNGAEFEYSRSGDVYIGSLVHDGNFIGRYPNQLGHIDLPAYS
jgi:hypothetical protein